MQTVATITVVAVILLFILLIFSKGFWLSVANHIKDWIAKQFGRLIIAVFVIVLLVAIASIANK